MATLHVSGLSKAHGADVVFQDVGFRLPPGDRLALVGRNGSGKTTLLRILAGEVDADAGDVSYPRGFRIALHDQRPPRAEGRTLGDYVGEGLGDVHAAEKLLGELEQRMADGDYSEETLNAYSDAQTKLDHAGGYAWRARLESILRGLGFCADHLERPLETFSGGELTRASLARALISNPDLLLLDEPTNHLDLQSLDWLERELQSFEGSVLLVSHDRWFLEAVATGVLEFERGRGRLFAMRYSAYRREKAMMIEQQADAFERQKEELERLERFVQKFKAGTRSRQAKSVEKRIQRTERVERPLTERALKFGFPKTVRPGRIVAEVDGLRVSAGDKLLVRDGSFAIERGSRVALIGPNGAGKTTLVETLLGRRRADAGRVKIGHNVEVAYFTQHAEELPEDATLLEAVCMGTSLNQNTGRGMLGRFMFSGDDIEKRVSVLSGGERRRLSLARLCSRGANLLVLDEPTNHMDVESREAIETALDAYDGTILLISHDRALIDALATDTLALEEQTLTLRPGDYNDYLRLKEERAVRDRPAAAANGAGPARQAPAKTAPPKRPAPAQASSKRKPSQSLVRRVKQAESRIEAVEAEIAGLERDLADPAVIADRDLLGTAAERHKALQEELAWLLREWEEASEALAEA